MSWVYSAPKGKRNLGDQSLSWIVGREKNWKRKSHQQQSLVDIFESSTQY